MRFAWLVLAGCFNPTFVEGVPCSTTQPCPNGQQCVGGVCNGVEPDPPPQGDGPAADAPSTGGDGDTCATAIPLSLDDSTTLGTLAGAGDDITAPTCGSGGIEVIYVVTLAQPTSVGFKVSSPNFIGHAYTSPACPPTTVNTCTDVKTNGSSAGTSFPAGNVFLFVERNSGTGTTFDIKPN